MPTRSKTFRIFVSSTFADMKAERGALQEHVFPKLQKLCEAHGCRFQAVDMRWGVSEEAALDQQTMNICLMELKRCRQVSPRPNFIILLGDRYGWIPLSPQIEAAEFDSIRAEVADPDGRKHLDDWYRLDTNAVPPEYVLRARREDVPEEADYEAWGSTERTLHAILLDAVNRLDWPANDKRREKYECSATHQEIIHGALDLPDEREHVFAFLRNIRNVDKLKARNDYIDDGVQKARALKETVKGIKGVTSFDYPVTWSESQIDSHIAKFTADALNSLTRTIEEEIAQIEDFDNLTREDIAHEEFGAERCANFAGREDTLERIETYLRGGSISPLVVYGPSGSGKSALMAKAVLNASRAHPGARILQRYVGATPASTDIRSLLLNLCCEITRQYDGDAATVPTDYKDLVEELPKRMELAVGKQSLILFIDALDQLSSSDNAHFLNWLPVALPDNVKVVVSVLERLDDAGQCLRSAKSNLPTSALLRMEDMSVDEGAEALGEWLSKAHRGLTEDQWTSILFRFSFCPYPLYLKLAFEAARKWKSYDSPHELTNDIPGLVNGMLARLSDKRQHGDVLVATFLGLLSAARHGLSETEILELLSADDKVMTDLRFRSARSPETNAIPSVVWLRLYHDLAPYLIERSADGATLYNFYHRQVEETVKSSLFCPILHEQLVRFFGDDRRRPLWHVEGVSQIPDCRRCAELPYHLLEIAKAAVSTHLKAESWTLLCALLTNADFLDAKIQADTISAAKWPASSQSIDDDYASRPMLSELIQDYDDTIAAIPLDNTRLRCLHCLREFLVRHLVQLSRSPLSLGSQFSVDFAGETGLLGDMRSRWNYRNGSAHIIRSGQSAVDRLETHAVDLPILRNIVAIECLADSDDALICSQAGDILRIDARRRVTTIATRIETSLLRSAFVGPGSVLYCLSDKNPDLQMLDVVSLVVKGRLQVSVSEPGSGSYSKAASAIAIAGRDAIELITEPDSNKRVIVYPRREKTSAPYGANEIRFNPTGSLLAVACYSGDILIFDTRSCSFRREKGYCGVGASCLAFEADEVLWAGSLEGKLLRWDLKTNSRTLFKSADDPVQSIAWLPIDRQLVSAHESGTLRGWDLTQTTAIFVMSLASRSIRTIARHDGVGVLLAGTDEVMLLPARGPDLSRLTFPEFKPVAHAIAPLVSQVIVSSGAVTVHYAFGNTGPVDAVPIGAIAREIKLRHGLTSAGGEHRSSPAFPWEREEGVEVTRLSAAADAELLYIGCSDGSVLGMDVSSRKIVVTILGNTDPVVGLCCNRNGGWIVFAAGRTLYGARVNANNEVDYFTRVRLGRQLKTFPVLAFLTDDVVLCDTGRACDIESRVGTDVSIEESILEIRRLPDLKKQSSVRVPATLSTAVYVKAAASIVAVEGDVWFSHSPYSSLTGEREFKVGRLAPIEHRKYDLWRIPIAIDQTVANFTGNPERLDLGHVAPPVGLDSSLADGVVAVLSTDGNLSLWKSEGKVRVQEVQLKSRSAAGPSFVGPSELVCADSGRGSRTGPEVYRLSISK